MNGIEEKSNNLNTSKGYVKTAPQVDLLWGDKTLERAEKDGDIVVHLINNHRTKEVSSNIRPDLPDNKLKSSKS